MSSRSRAALKLLEAVEAVAAVAHHLAGLADIAELLRKLQQANLGTDNLLFSRHDVLQCRGGALRHPDRSAPRLGLRFAVGIEHRCQIRFWLMHKVRYRGIAKNGAQVFSLLALANLYLARRTFASA